MLSRLAFALPFIAVGIGVIAVGRRWLHAADRLEDKPPVMSHLRWGRPREFGVAICLLGGIIIAACLVGVVAPSGGSWLVFAIAAVWITEMVRYARRSRREQSQPGWYADPENPDQLRWWTGTEWTELSSAPRPVSGWQRWVISSPASLRVDKAVQTAACIGMVTALLVVAYTLLAGRPAAGGMSLLALAFPIIFASQLWVIGVLLARRPMQPATKGRLWGTSTSWPSDTRKFFFEGLPKALATAFLAVAAAGWLAGMTAWPALARGGPASPQPGCRWPLDSHGTITCVDAAEYHHAGAAEQRFGAGVLLGFFAIHCGAATAELYRRRGGAPPAPPATR